MGQDYSHVQQDDERIEYVLPIPTTQDVTQFADYYFYNKDDERKSKNIVCYYPFKYFSLTFHTPSTMFPCAIYSKNPCTRVQVIPTQDHTHRIEYNDSGCLSIFCNNVMQTCGNNVMQPCGKTHTFKSDGIARVRKRSKFWHYKGKQKESYQCVMIISSDLTPNTFKEAAKIYAGLWKPHTLILILDCPTNYCFTFP